MRTFIGILSSLIVLLVTLALSLPIGLHGRSEHFLSQQPLSSSFSRTSSAKIVSTCGRISSFSSSSSSHGRPDRSKSPLSKSLRLFMPSSSKSFKCHAPDATSSLRSLADYLTNLVKDYRDMFFDHKDAPTPKVEVCCGSWGDEDESKPSIYFEGLSKSQTGQLMKLIKNQVQNRMKGVNFKKAGVSGLVVTQDEEQF